MGFFTPKISNHEKVQVQNLLKQIKESAHLVNTTVNPDIYFGRLHFMLDALMELQKYEKYKIFKGNGPTKDFKMLQNNLEQSVDDFIMRSYTKRLEKASLLKTEKAKFNNMKKYSDSMVEAFDNAPYFWEGNGIYPHYTGLLYTQKNWEKLNSLLFDYRGDIPTLHQ